MSVLDKISALGKKTQDKSNTLDLILEQLIKLNQKQDVKYRKEWYPLFFHFYTKGYYVADPSYGTNKWGFKRIPGLNDLKLDFDYEFHSLELHTENRTYKPALRLIINGSVYPNVQRIVSGENNFDGFREFQGHNYNYQRCYQFSNVETYQSGYGSAHYPFKMIVERPWFLNFEIFQTTTSVYWHTLVINGWRLHPIEKEKIEELII